RKPVAPRARRLPGRLAQIRVALGVGGPTPRPPRLRRTALARRDRPRRAHAAGARRAGLRRHTAILPLPDAAAAGRAHHFRSPTPAAAPHAAPAAPGDAGRPRRRAAPLRPTLPLAEPAARLRHHARDDPAPCPVSYHR